MITIDDLRAEVMRIPSDDRAGRGFELTQQEHLTLRAVDVTAVFDPEPTRPVVELRLMGYPVRLVRQPGPARFVSLEGKAPR